MVTSMIIGTTSKGKAIKQLAHILLFLYTLTMHLLLPTDIKDVNFFDRNFGRYDDESDLESAYWRGYCRLYGIGGSKKNLELAISDFQFAANDHGEAPGLGKAMFRLWQLSALPDLDDEDREEWVQDASAKLTEEAEDLDPESMCCLGLCLVHGMLDFEPDLAAAANWLFGSMRRKNRQACSVVAELIWVGYISIEKEYHNCTNAVFAFECWDLCMRAHKALGALDVDAVKQYQQMMDRNLLLLSSDDLDLLHSIRALHDNEKDFCRVVDFLYISPRPTCSIWPLLMERLGRNKHGKHLSGKDGFFRMVKAALVENVGE